MFTTFRRNTHRYAILAALAVFLVKILYLASTPTRGLVMVPWIIDDSYINMRVARNVALGLGFSFNGIDPTNGAPFLWTYITSLNHLLLPFFAAIKITFMESAFFAMLATLVTYAIAWKTTQNALASWLALLLAMLTGNAFMEAMNGMDTALFTLFVLLSIAFYVGVGTSRITDPLASGFVLGLPVGLSILERGDGLFLAVALGILLLVQLWKERAQPRRALLYLVGFCLSAGLCLIVLMGWGWIHAGSVFPANQVGRRDIALGWHGALHGISVAKYFKVVAWNVFQLEQLLSVATASSLLALAGLLFGIVKLETRKLSIVTALYCAIFFGMLVGYQWYFPNMHGLRYINPAVHLLCILIAVFLARSFVGSLRAIPLAIMTVGIVALSWYSFYGVINSFPWAASLSYTGHTSQAEVDRFWAFFDWTKQHIPKGSIVGVRDNGQFALFTDLPVQDLSGVIDPTVAKDVRAGGSALAEYLKQKHVDYLWIPSPEERQDTLYQLLRDHLRLQLVPGAPASVYESHLYRIHWKA